MDQHLIVASHGMDGYLSHMILDENGKLTCVETWPAACPDFLDTHADKLYVMLRAPLRDQGGIAVYNIAPDGSVAPTGEVLLTRGSIPSYVLWHKDKLYATNYITGTTIRLPDRMIVHLGSSVHPQRQECSHPHCIMPIPQTDFLAVADLGTDKLYVLDEDLNLISELKMPDGFGPRHLVFTKDGRKAWCANELASSVTALDVLDGRFVYKATYSTLPENFMGESSCGGIRLSEDEKTLYVSNRGHDSIVLFDIDGDALTPRIWLSSGGSSPREFRLVGEYLLCGNENSNSIVVLRADGSSDVPISEVKVQCPWCIQPILTGLH